MLKNKFKMIAFLLVLMLAFTIPSLVLAENETIENAIQAPEAAENTVTENTVSEENFKKGDVYLTGNDVTIDYIIDGNLFVFANNVTINSQIGGDAFICANTITVGEQGYVFSNLFALAKNVTVNGVVYDLYSTSENTTIHGYVYRDLRISANTANIYGTVGRNAFISCNNLSFTQNTDMQNEKDKQNVTSQGMINGNLQYSSKQEASIPEGVVTGETNFIKDEIFSASKLQTYILSLGAFVVTVAVIWLICLWLAPKFLEKTSSFISRKKILPVVGLGIITPIILVVVSIILFLLGITSTLGLLTLFVLFILMGISTSIFVITINKMICDKLKMQKKITTFGMLIIASIVLWLIGLIPYVGSIIGIACMIVGLGIIVSNLILKEKKEEK